jgi:hypothetical protein
MTNWAKRFFTVAFACAALGVGCGGGDDDDDDDGYAAYGGGAAAPAGNTGGFVQQPTTTGGVQQQPTPTGGIRNTGGNIFVPTGGVQQTVWQNCPSSAMPNATCANIGQECVYGNTVCTCAATGYVCVTAGTGGSGGNDPLCPATPPQDGRSCEFEQMGIVCTYGGMTCTCYFPIDTLYWRCEGEIGTGGATGVAGGAPAAGAAGAEQIAGAAGIEEIAGAAGGVGKAGAFPGGAPAVAGAGGMSVGGEAGEPIVVAGAGGKSAGGAPPVAGGGGAAGADQCPTAQPDDGDTCAPQGLQCDYADEIQCYCSVNGWVCG